MSATDIRTLAQLHEAEDELERHGLIEVKRRRNGDRNITMLDPATRKPLRFPKEN